MTTFSSSSELTESFDASCQLAQAPVTFPHLMEEQHGDVWREQPAGVSQAETAVSQSRKNACRRVAIGKCDSSSASLTFPWPQSLSRSLINPNVQIPGLRSISLICWRFYVRWLRQSEVVEGVEERSIVSTVDNIIIHSSLDSSCNCKHVFNALKQKTHPKQCCLPFQWPHKDTRRLFRVIFMTKVRLIQL